MSYGRAAGVGTPTRAGSVAASAAAAVVWASFSSRGGSMAGSRSRPPPAATTPPTTSAAVTTAATSHAPTRLPIAHHPESRRSFEPHHLDAATTPGVPTVPGRPVRDALAPVSVQREDTGTPDPLLAWRTALTRHRGAWLALLLLAVAALAGCAGGEPPSGVANIPMLDNFY